MISLSRVREREGPAKREGEGLLSSYLASAAWKKKEDPHPTLSRTRERAKKGRGVIPGLSRLICD